MWNGFVLVEPSNAVFLTNKIRILSGIGPRNALSIETCWDPELALKVLMSMSQDNVLFVSFPKHWREQAKEGVSIQRE